GLERRAGEGREQAGVWGSRSERRATRCSFSWRSIVVEGPIASTGLVRFTCAILAWFRIAYAGATVHPGSTVVVRTGELRMTESETPSQEPRRVLIVMAHPDDGEFSSAGTLARWASEGRDIYYCLITDGQAGDQGDTEITTEELAALRQREAQAAADA